MPAHGQIVLHVGREMIQIRRNPSCKEPPVVSPGPIDEVLVRFKCGCEFCIPKEALIAVRLGVSS